MTDNKKEITLEDRMNSTEGIISYFGEEGERKLKELMAKSAASRKGNK